MAAHVTRQVSPRMGLALHAPSAMDLKAGARMLISFRMGYAVGGVGSQQITGTTGVRPVAGTGRLHDFLDPLSAAI
jgi:hypothetical protein